MQSPTAGPARSDALPGWRRAARTIASAVARLYPLPDFLILGAQKAGTSSLHQYLAGHPQVIAAREKEVHFFDNQFGRGSAWYRRRFPSRARLALERARRGAPVLTGEATPMYLVHPQVPARIAALVPRTRLIVLLREPAARAYSQWQHNQRMGWDPLPFAAAIAQEEARIAPALAAMAQDPLCVDTRFHAWCYKTRGRYLEQLQRYEALFPRDRILVLCAEDLFRDPGAVYDRTLEFLGLAPHRPAAGFAPANVGRYAQAEAATFAALRRYFAPHNEALFAHLGRRLPWDEAGG